MAAKTVDDYVKGLGPEQAAVVTQLRKIIHSAAPKATESIKWAQPVYEEGGPMVFIKAFKSHVNFGFWRGAQFPDPKSLLQGDGDRMRHVKLTSVKDIRPKEFSAFVKRAVKLNRELGDPTKRR